jgi:Holliday junction resolvase RusA-like endonuclease
MRIKQSIGAHFKNGGSTIPVLDDQMYGLDKTRAFYLFDVVPMGAVRMSQSDRWKTNPNHLDPRKRQRKSVTEHFAFKDALRLQAKSMGFELKTYLDCVFMMPMPDSWSEKKKDKMNGLPCKVRPDIDNLCKIVVDSLKSEDGDVWSIKAEKRWAYKGSIIIFA